MRTHWIAVVAALLSCPVSALAQTNAPALAGWPVTLTGSGVARFSKPLVVDLDNNGSSKEVVVGTSAGKLYVLNANGAVRTGWPKTLPAEIGSSPAAGDLDGDGDFEIVVGFGSNLDLNLAGGVRAFRSDGSVLWTFSPADTDGNGQPDHVWATPAVGDLDGDGVDDVAFGSWDFNAYALKGSTGQPLPGWPVFVRDSIWSSSALADLDGDGKLEIIMGADAHFEGPPIDTPNGGALFVFRRNGTFFPGFPQFVGYPNGVTPVGFFSSPAVGDITGDGCPEIVIGTGTSQSTDGKKAFAWHSDGTMVAGWPVALQGHPDSSPALADLTGDGVQDVVITDDTARVYGINGSGTILWQKIPKTFTGASAVAISDPIAAQVGSNNPAILVGSVGFDVTILSKTGTQISDDGTHGAGMLTYTTGHPVPGVVATDLNNDNVLDIVAASGASAGSETDGKVYVWTAGTLGALPWPMFRHDARRSGKGAFQACVPPSPALNFYTVTPCRVSDSRQPGNGTWGGPALVAGEQRTITITGRCAIPAGAKAVSFNVTVTGSTREGDLRLFPGGNGAPNTSTINFGANQTRANNAILPLSYDGRGHLTVLVDMQGAGQVHVILDVNGYFM